MVQYEMYFTNEYTKEILYDLAEVMSLHIEETSIEKAVLEKDKSSQNNLFFLEEKGQFICVDCNDNDWIFPLVVVCNERIQNEVKEVMLRWDNLIREEYAQELTGDIVNVYDKENTLLHNIEEVYGIELRLSLHLPNGQV